MTNLPPASHLSLTEGTITVDTLARIDDVLQQMWHVDSEITGGEESQGKGVIRVCLGNIVVVAEREQLPEILETLDRLSARRPSRVLVAEIVDGKLEGGIHASIRAVCHLPAPGAAQVCCETIQLQFDEESAALMPGVILPLLEPDLPTLLWWTRDLMEQREMLLRLAHDAGAFFFDLDRIVKFRGIRQLLRDLKQIDLHDFSWNRMEPWRRALAHSFDDPAAREMLPRIREVVLSVHFGERGCKERESVPATALLYLGWMAAQLKWELDGPLECGGSFLKTTAMGPGGPIELRIEPMEKTATEGRTCGSLDSVLVKSGEESEVHLERMEESRTIVSSMCSPMFCPLKRRVSGTALAPDEIIGGVLEDTAYGDPIYVKALDYALKLVGC